MFPLVHAYRRQRGGVTATVLLFVALLALAYGGYRAYAFYQESVAPVVEGVAKVAAKLNPYTLTKNPAEVEEWLKTSFNIAPPEDYVGAFGLNVEWLGQKHVRVMALIPKGARPSDIFEGGRNEIRFNPGTSTIFLAAQFPRSTREEMQEAIEKLVQGDAQSAPLMPVYLEAGGRRVAALRGTAQNYGATNTVVMVFLDDGRMFYAAGPKASFDEQALDAALAELVATHPANEFLYQHPPPQMIAAPSPDPCGIPGVKGEFDVVVVSVRQGSAPVDFSIEKSGHEVAQEDVVVGATAKPIILVLMGHDPIVWNVGRAEGAQIAGVLAEGYYRQAVIGLPKSTRITTYSNSDGANACPYFRAEKPDSSEYTAMQRRIKELFGRGIGTFMNKKAGGRFTVGDVSGEVGYSPDVTLKSVALPNTVMPAGKRGIDRLVKEQAIRPATEEEVATWVKGAAERKGQPLDKYRRSMDWRLRQGDVYIVQKPFDLPDDLAGANARTFILPVGAARPGGPQGHCTFLVMDGFQCYGTACS